jgi:hypothetical protein
LLALGRLQHARARLDAGGIAIVDSTVTRNLLVVPGDRVA